MVYSFKFFNGFETIIKKKSFYADSDLFQKSEKCKILCLNLSKKLEKIEKMTPLRISKTAKRRDSKFCTNLGYKQ